MKRKSIFIVAFLVIMLYFLPNAVLAGTSTTCEGGENCEHSAKIGNTHYDTLEEAFSNVQTGETITLLKDYSYTSNGSGLLNITKSCTIDGNGKTISGWGNRSGQKTTIAINNSGSSFIEVEIKNLTISNSASMGRPIETRGNISKLTLENCNINTDGDGNTQGLTIGGSQETNAIIDIKNTNINAGNSGYPIIAFNPMTLTITGGKIEGFCGIYFKGEVSSYGSRNSVVDINKTTFECPNVHQSGSNDFGVLVFEDDGIDVNINDCKINALSKSECYHSVFLLSSYSARREKAIKTSISGDSVIDGTLLCIDSNWNDENIFESNITGGIFSDSEVIQHALRAVIKFKDNSSDAYFVGTDKEINKFVENNSIKEVSVMKSIDGYEFVFPEDTKVVNETENDVVINDDKLSAGEEVVVKESATSTTPVKPEKDPITNESSESDEIITQTPQTGDNSNIFISVIMGIISIAGIVVVTRKIYS